MSFHFYAIVTQFERRDASGAQEQRMTQTSKAGTSTSGDEKEEHPRHDRRYDFSIVSVVGEKARLFKQACYTSRLHPVWIMKNLCDKAAGFAVNIAILDNNC
ncbi:unnamed protein product [Amoebophrya sp. A120]|nr:unnamed protein product [Amoebophrya sp. A120]|eukprot:GSA120T00005808001.1